MDGSAADGAVGASERFWSLGGERVELGGAALVHHPTAPGQPLGTFVTSVRTASAAHLALVLDRCDELVDGGCRRLVVDAATPPVAEAHLALGAWRPQAHLQLELPAAVAVPAPGAALRPLAGDADWERITELFRTDHLEEDARHGLRPRPDAATDAAVALRRALTPAATWFVVERDDEFVAFVAAWPGDRGTAVVEDVFVRPEARGRGLAGELLRFAVGHVRASGAGPVAISAEIDDRPKHLYTRFGFRPVAVVRGWER